MRIRKKAGGLCQGKKVRKMADDAKENPGRREKQEDSGTNETNIKNHKREKTG